MYPDSFVFAIVAQKKQSGDERLALSLRELTIVWSRYEYRGRILEGPTVDSVLARAAELGYRWCLVQASGNIILEGGQAENSTERFRERVLRLTADHAFLALGARIGDAERGYGLADQCLLVDVQRYEHFGRPAYGHPTVERPFPGWNFIDTSLREGLPIYDIGPMLAQHCLALDCLSHTDKREFARYLEKGIHRYRDDATGLDSHTRRFLRDIQRNVANARRGVFLWNLEPYDDIAKQPRGFEAPISTLYCVASGFKPNAILDSLGFDDRTRVVYFDYSAKALDARRMLVTEWNGHEFPEFARYMFKSLSPDETYYHLASADTPQTLDWNTVDQAWRRELETWGGERRFAEHWSRYCALDHEYVHCDLLSDASQLLTRVRPERAGVIWWSNAFFTVYGNWLFTIAQRKRMFEDWILALAGRNPGLFLYGSDFSNISVNDIRAGEYVHLVRNMKPNELLPINASALEIRF